MMNDNPVIFLIGPRGAGKTSVGRSLARNLKYDFYDTDALVCSQAGLTVAEIVTQEGWDTFRQRESEALSSVANHACVIATGGGMVLKEDNRSLMRSKGIVFFLSASPGVLYERLAKNVHDAQRPSLTDKGLLLEIQSILAEREHLYHGCAHHCLDAAAPLPKVVSSILRILHRRKGK